MTPPIAFMIAVVGDGGGGGDGCRCGGAACGCEWDYDVVQVIVLRVAPNVLSYMLERTKTKHKAQDKDLAVAVGRRQSTKYAQVDRCKKGGVAQQHYVFLRFV